MISTGRESLWPVGIVEQQQTSHKSRAEVAESEHEQAQKQLEGIKRNLIENMELYGYPKDQAEIQLQALIGAVRRVVEIELY